MKKKSISIIVIVTILIVTLTGCGNLKKNEKNENVNNNQANENASKNETTNNIDVKAEEENKDYYNWNSCVKMYCPTWLKYENEYGYLLWGGKLDTDDKIYYHLATDGYYDKTREDYIENYSYKNVPDIIADSLDEMVYAKFGGFSENYKRNVDTEEVVTCNGYKFLRVTGTMHVEKYPEDAQDLYYIAYYGCMDMELFDNRSVPMMWASFAKITDEKTKDEMANLVDTAAKNIKFY